MADETDYQSPCPYCGGDESRCDFDFVTERCSEAEYQSRRRDMPSEAAIERQQRRLAAILGEPYPSDPFDPDPNTTRRTPWESW